jgi:hypothetical protein
LGFFAPENRCDRKYEVVKLQVDSIDAALNAVALTMNVSWARSKAGVRTMANHGDPSRIQAQVLIDFASTKGWRSILLLE